MQHSRSSRPGGPLRRLVLGGAFAAGAMLAFAPPAEDVLAAGNAAAAVVAQAATPRDAGTAPAAPAEGAKGANGKPAAAAGARATSAPPAPGATAPKAKTPGDADESEAKSDEEAAGGKDSVIVGSHGIVIQKGSKRVRVEGLGSDREYDSFEQFVQDAPWLAGLVFVTVLLVFLVPLLIIVLLIWYKIRKNRMANETMLKLAERGVVPPAAAMDAVASGNAVPLAEAATTPPPGVPAYEHAKALQRRAVWSDLRKGVILGGIGLGLTFWSMLDDGTPNGLGLVFLFVGIGYGLLWYFEDGKRAQRRDPSVTPPPGGA